MNENGITPASKRAQRREGLCVFAHLAGDDPLGQSTLLEESTPLDSWQETARKRRR